MVRTRPANRYDLRQGVTTEHANPPSRLCRGGWGEFIVAGAGPVDLEKTWIPAGVEHTLELSAVDVHAAFFKAHSKSS